MDGVVSEVRSVSFSRSGVFPTWWVAILRELAQGPTGEIDSPALPLLGDLLTADPVLVNSESTGGSVIELEFACNLDDMLEAYGLTRAQSMASCAIAVHLLPQRERHPRVHQRHARKPAAAGGGPGRVHQLCGKNAPTAKRLFHLALRLLYPVLLPTRTVSTCAGQASSCLYTQRMSPRTLLIELARGPRHMTAWMDSRR